MCLLYHGGTYSNSYANMMAATFLQILRELSTRTVQDLSEIECISPKDRIRILSWNPTLPKALPTCIHHMVSRKVKEIPKSEAICAWDGSLTYSQLEQLSTTLAARLTFAGVKVGDYIPFAFEKSVWAVVGMLAILKAGGAFVPLDPSHPKVRLGEILKSTNAKIVVTSQSLSHLFDKLDESLVVVFADTSASGHKKQVVLPDVRPSDPVFVLFTSGSTGQPKGMIHEHGAICTYFITHGELMGYHGARVLQFSAYTFDAAILDIFTTLIFGGSVCVPSEQDRISNIIGVINEMKVDFALLTPSFANLVHPDNVPTLSRLCVAGESLTQEVVERWAHRVRLMNAYGPAEVGICFLMTVVRKTRAETIGYPLLNCSCWLVDPDDQDRLAPIGAVGELLVASPSLARGYLNNEAKTKSSFIAGLAWAESVGLKDCTFFKTGDLLKYNIDALDGSCDYVRRKDNQIKLRGQRIEAGDIEYRLAKLPSVAVSVVVQAKSGCFAGELVAVLQLSSSKAPRISNRPISLDPHGFLDQDMIRCYLSSHLPGYMIPIAYLAVASMPFIPSGKIDRKGILTWVSSFETRPFMASGGTLSSYRMSVLDTQEVTAHALSKKVADLVARKDEVRGLMLLGHDFNLSDAGVDSIQMIQLLLFLRTFGVPFPACKLWSTQTSIRDLAYLIDHGGLQLGDAKFADTDCLQEYQSCQQELLKDLTTAQSIPNHTPISNIFVTGISGFVGLRILQNLMTRSESRVFALVRCNSPSQGKARLISSAQKQGWWSESYENRIHVWPGDLGASNLGLSDSHLDSLLGRSPCGENIIHAIIHNGAHVHYNLAFDALKPLNINPTLFLLKSLSHAPSISTFLYHSGGTPPSAHSSTLTERATQANRINGYGQTKFVSEALVQHCMTYPALSAKRIHVVKPGYIIGAVDGDEPNKTDFLWRIIAACLEVRGYDQSNAQHWIFVSDVETVAGRLGRLVLAHSGENGNETSNVLEGLRVEELWGLLRAEFGYKLEGLSGEEWRRRLERAILERGEEHVLFPFAHKLRTDALSIGEATEDRPHDGHGDGRVLRALRWNLRRLVAGGYFPPPPPSPKP